MDNKESVIHKHNAKILKPKPENKNSTCGCRKKDDCPLNGKCLNKDIVYKAAVTFEGETEIYFRLTSTDFKTRHNNHNNSFIKREKAI